MNINICEGMSLRQGIICTIENTSIYAGQSMVNLTGAKANRAKVSVMAQGLGSIAVRCPAHLRWHGRRVEQHEHGRHNEIKRRYRRRASHTKPQFATLRLRDLAQLIRGRHGIELPNDNAGRLLVEIVAHHLAMLSGNPVDRIDRWVGLWAPWYRIGDLAELRVEVLRFPKRWKADQLAWVLGLNEFDRRALGITTIGAVDMSKRERMARRRQRARARRMAKHRANGVKPRAQYLASVKSATPWVAAGISRATWYRRQRET